MVDHSPDVDSVDSHLALPSVDPGHVDGVLERVDDVGDAGGLHHSAQDDDGAVMKSV